MQARYRSGSRVRVKSPKQSTLLFDDMARFDGLTGEIVASTSLVGFLVSPWNSEEGPGPATSLPFYKVRLDIGVSLDIMEHCLELADVS